MNKRPTRLEILEAAGKTVPDIIDFNLKVLFCGINPGLYTAAVGHHFARPGNRFWPALFSSGFTDRLLSPFEERELLKMGFGITNVAARATARAEELTKKEFIEGGKKLVDKIHLYTPEFLAILGIGAYKTAFNRPKAALGLQNETIGKTKLWILPSPSGLNAHYNNGQLTALFNELYRLITDKK
ncbi:MAG: G/U mismatch-specific DNA glycosylase [Bacteroidota bacterium]|nr:G/U mismatch-specific DNA glycosylase [Bacteroidota bacterium]MDP4197012.1 G/U mismatch-specific DNA glycosylase [Bacteroidota bacterium]